MPIRVRVEGETFSTADLTLAELADLEHRLGKGLRDVQLHRSAGDLLGVLVFFASRVGPRAVSGVREMSLAEAAQAVDFVDYDLPVAYQDGLPVGGSIVDEFLCVFCRPPFNRLPDEVRRQNPRDLLLILEAMDRGED